MLFGYDCVVCQARYLTRRERNEHLETHFIHKKCDDCNRLVILIGDLEFELHRPKHCTKVSSDNDCEDLQSFVAIEKLKEDAVDGTAEDNENDIDVLSKPVMKEDTDSDDCPLSIVADTSRSSVCAQEVLPKEEEDTTESKQTEKKRIRKKPTKKTEDPSGDKKTTRTQKSRPAKMITCTQEGCNEEFRQQQFLRKHMKTAHGIVEKHLCSICKFAFADKSNLKHHMVTHTDDKRFICSFCGARFHKLTNMTEHMNAHLGLKPYKCEICGKDFGRSNHKRQHMRVNRDRIQNR